MARRYALVAAGGALGTALRYGLGSLAPASAGQVPWTTLAINISGSFLLGIVAGRYGRTDGRRLFAGAGVLGGYTTFGTVAVEVMQLGRAGEAVTAGLNGVLTIAAGVLAAAVGMTLATRIGAEPAAKGDQ